MVLSMLWNLVAGTPESREIDKENSEPEMSESSAVALSSPDRIERVTSASSTDEPKKSVRNRASAIREAASGRGRGRGAARRAALGVRPGMKNGSVARSVSMDRQRKNFRNRESTMTTNATGGHDEGEFVGASPSNSHRAVSPGSANIEVINLLSSSDESESTSSQHAEPDACLHHLDTTGRSQESMNSELKMAPFESTYAEESADAETEAREKQKEGRVGHEECDSDSYCSSDDDVFGFKKVNINFDVTPPKDIRSPHRSYKRSPMTGSASRTPRRLDMSTESDEMAFAMGDNGPSNWTVTDPDAEHFIIPKNVILFEPHTGLEYHTAKGAKLLREREVEEEHTRSQDTGKRRRTDVEIVDDNVHEIVEIGASQSDGDNDLDEQGALMKRVMVLPTETGFSEITVEFSGSALISEVIAHCAEVYKVRPQDIELLDGYGEVVNSNHRLFDLQSAIFNLRYVPGVDDIEALATQEAHNDASAAEGYNRIVVTLRHESDTKDFSVSPEDPIRKALEAFAKYIKKNAKKLKILYDGDVIKPHVLIKNVVDDDDYMFDVMDK